MCMYLLCGFWNFKVTLSLELAAMGKDEKCGKHHVSSSFWIFQTMCQAKQLMETDFLLDSNCKKSASFKTPWKVGLFHFSEMLLSNTFKKKGPHKIPKVSSFSVPLDLHLSFLQKMLKVRLPAVQKKGTTNEFKKYLLF